VRRQAVFFVVPAHAMLLDIAGPADALRLASTFGACLQGEAMAGEGEPHGHVYFDLHFIGPAPHAPTSIGLPFSGIAPLPETLPAGAIVVIVGVTRPEDAAARREADEAVDATVAWLARTMGGKSRPASADLRVFCVCEGALIAARAGLLDERRCTTHHTLLKALADIAPRAKVLENRLYVTDGFVSTSAGITAGIDMTLQMIAELAGPRTASLVAREMVVYMRRAGGDPQLSPWVAGRNHLHPALHRVQDAIAADPARDWSVEAMADVACTSARNLTRLFARYAGGQPLDYVHRLRVALARELIAHSTLDMESVAARAGFGSARHMRRVWAKYDAESPSVVRARARVGEALEARTARRGSRAG
jgi:transcriptional regulator GlxA family with amidase domain